MMLNISLRPRLRNRSIDAKALLDSGATANFIHYCLVQKYKMKTHPLCRQMLLHNTDDTENIMGHVTEKVYLAMNVWDATHDKNHTEVVKFFVTNLGTDDLILGHTWLYKHNPIIDWKEDELGFNQCPPICSMSMDDKWHRSTYFPASFLAGQHCQKHRLGKPLRQRRTTQSTEFAATENKKKAERTIEEMVPEHYLKYQSVFEESASHK